MQPTGILRTSKFSNPSKLIKSVSWGMLYSLSEDRQQTVQSIPTFTSKEVEAQQREDEKQFFGQCDISGLQSSRRRASISSLVDQEPPADPHPRQQSPEDLQDMLPTKSRRSRSSNIEPLAPTQPNSPGLLDSDSFCVSRRRCLISCKNRLTQQS
jgi:hypothetical protein